METDIQVWKKNFESHLASIKIEFDSFFLNREVSDFYILEEDAGISSLVLHINFDSKLPKQIEDGLVKAFADSRPL